MAKVKIRIPTRFLMTAPQKGTVAIRVKGGRFNGREVVNRGPGDTTKLRYLLHNTDLNHNGRIDADEHGGTAHGRSVKVKASGRASGRVKGYERRV